MAGRLSAFDRLFGPMYLQDWRPALVRHPLLLAGTMFAIVAMRDVQVAMAADYTPGYEAQITTLPDRSDRRQPAGPAPFSLFPDTNESQNGEVAQGLSLVGTDSVVSDHASMAPGVLERDWRGLGRDTGFFLGYQVAVAGTLYLLPEDVTKWTPEQRRTSMRRWWENVQNPHWDPDNWFVNYVGHPYFGAISYIRARERRFGTFGGFWYAALLSGLYEFGIEALFEQPSYQDLIVTPVAGVLIGALLFEPIRERIRGKPELLWYDHLALTATDPMGAANDLFERVLGIQADVRVQFHLPGQVPHAQYSERSTGTLNRPQEKHRWSPGVGIEFVFGGRRQSAVPR